MRICILGPGILPLSMHLAELTSPQLAALPRETPIVFPIAALEQHSGHLPVVTDTRLVGEVEIGRAHV